MQRGGCSDQSLHSAPRRTPALIGGNAAEVKQPEQGRCPRCCCASGQPRGSCSSPAVHQLAASQCPAPKHTYTHTQSHEQETSMVLHTTCMGFFHEMQPLCQKKKILEQSAIFSSIISSFVRDGQKCKNCIIVSTHRFHFHDSLTQHKIVPLQLTLGGATRPSVRQLLF